MYDNVTRARKALRYVPLSHTHTHNTHTQCSPRAQPPRRRENVGTCKSNNISHAGRTPTHALFTCICTRITSRGWQQVAAPMPVGPHETRCVRLGFRLEATSFGAWARTKHVVRGHVHVLALPRRARRAASIATHSATGNATRRVSSVAVTPPPPVIPIRVCCASQN
jgi:hypothetical protein